MNIIFLEYFCLFLLHIFYYFHLLINIIINFGLDKLIFETHWIIQQDVLWGNYSYFLEIIRNYFNGMNFSVKIVIYPLYLWLVMNCFEVEFSSYHSFAALDSGNIVAKILIIN